MSFDRILRSSALIGGAQVVVLAAGFIRTKVVALILGAAGVGLIGVLNAFVGNLAAFAGWGLGVSGVRLIASSTLQDRTEKVAAVRRMGWSLSLLGLALAAITFWPVSVATFESNQYALEMAVVALAIPCLIASTAWTAILQASGQIGSLAKVQIVGALAGLSLGLPFIYLWGSVGIALSILLAAAVPAATLWLAAARCEPVDDSALRKEDLRRLVMMGGALMAVGWLGQLSAYVVRVAIVRQEGLSSAGYFQAAYAISGSLPGFVFAAMGADFFPRVAAAKDELDAKELTEGQIKAGLLLGVPMIVILLTAGETCVRLLYADGFTAATSLLGWMTWGVFVRLFAWPLAFWLLARGSSKAVMIVEGAAALFTTLVSVVLLRTHGIEGCVVGLLLGQVGYFLFLLLVARRRSGCWLSAEAAMWIVFSTGACLAFQGVASLLRGSVWGLLPAALAVAAAVMIYAWTKLRS
jgi:PST family polysaccharide transporter